MRYILLIADGSADRPVAALDHRTPLESLVLPGFNRLAGGTLGLARTVPQGIAPGSDTAILTILGYDVRTCYTGRAALEAAGAGVTLAEGETGLRVNLCAVEGSSFSDAVIRSHNGGGIEGEEAQALLDSLLEDPGYQAAARDAGFTLHTSQSFRQIGVLAGAPDGAFHLGEPHNLLGQPVAEHLPEGNCADALRRIMEASFAALADHPVNRSRIARGKLAANCLWPWAAGQAMILPSFPERYGHSGPVISAVPLMKGIARLAGLPAPDVAGATGDVDTNYEGKVQALLDGLAAGADFGVLHVEAPDECSHAKDLVGKCEAIRRIDARVVRPLLDALPAVDPDFRILLLSDHLTLLETGQHDEAPVPFALYDSRYPARPEAGKPRFDETHAAQGCFVANGTRLMDLLFYQEAPHED